jgi:enoyl-CoA hydratase
VTIVRIDHPPVNAFDLGLVDDAVATVGSMKGPIVLTGVGSRWRRWRYADTPWARR